MCVNSLNINVLFEKDRREFGGLGFLYKHTHTHNSCINNKLKSAGRHNLGFLFPLFVK